MNPPEEDFSSIDFGDKRINARLKNTIESMRKNTKESILGALEERSQAKAFYRLLSNEKLDLGLMTEAVRKATIERMSGTVLLIQDTSDVNLNGHKKTEGLGYSSEHVRGVKLHSCIAVHSEGMPLGLVAQFYETRPEAKSSLTKAEKAARAIEEKESYRWLEMLAESTKSIPDDVNIITICDREGDFYELYAKLKETGNDFIIRVVHDRISDTNGKILETIRKKAAIGTVTVNIPRDSRNNIPARQAEMEIAYCTVNVMKPSTVKSTDLPEKLTMNLVRITEITASSEPGIEWILATSLPLNSADDAYKIVEYYIQRWKIERYHFVLKSGCSAEKIQQRTYEKIKPVLLIYSVIAMYIMAVTYIGRILPDTSCDVFFDEDEWKILYRIVNKTKLQPDKPYSMADAVKYLGQLGGYKRAPSDGPPGLKVIWKGLFKLYEFINLYEGLA